MRVLVTGGSGMVGRNLLEHPRAGNFEFVAPRRSELDLRSYEAVESYLKRLRPEIIVHAAAKVGGIQANVREPVRFLLENLDINRNVIWAARTSEVPRLINLGSSCMYPRNAPNPLNEETILQGELEPTNEGYAIAKIVAARLCQYIRREAPGFAYKTVIPCNIYGRYDKFDPVHSHLVAAVIHKLHAAKESGAEEVEIWGDGTARREFMYAGDLADFLITALERLDSLPEMINAGVGADHTIDEYYAIAARIIGYKGRFRHNLDKPTGMARKLVNTSKSATWGWRASTSLESGIAMTYDYYLAQCSHAT